MLTLDDAPETNGYARSKFLSELLCEVAAQHLGFPVTIARVGQVAGAIRQPGGEWDRKEWFPSLVIGSLSMGCLPSDLGSQFSEIDWLPADLLADVVVELVEFQEPSAQETMEGGAQVYNLRNPRTATCMSLVPSIIDITKTLLGSDRVPEIVPPSTRLERLENAASEDTEDGAMTNPAITLLDFYRNYLWGLGEQGAGQRTSPMSIEKALAYSTALRGSQSVGPQWMEKWISEWMT